MPPRDAGSGGVVGAAVLADPALLLETREDPVEVVGLDLHLLGDLRRADPRVVGDELHGLVGAGSAPPAPAAATGGRSVGGRSGRAAGPAASLPSPGEAR